MKIGFVSLGCSKNLVNTEVMLKILSDCGYEITPDDTEADIVVINTCGFIQSAKEEAIENILDVAWLKTHGKLRGMLMTENSEASVEASSTLTLQTLNSGCSSAISSTTGETILQGPHQSA